MTPAAPTVEPADATRDAATILALWRGSLAQNGMPERKFEWYYRSNPEGPPRVLLLRPPGTPDPVGALSLGPRRMRMGSRELVGGLLSDFVVLPGHRGFFPALALQRAMRTRGLESGHHVVYGLPNPQSEAIVRRAGYARVGDSVRYARVVRSAAYFSRHTPEWLANLLAPAVDRIRHGALVARGFGPLRARWLERVPDGLDAFWERAAPPDTLIGVRDAAFLRWRFVDCPLHRYRFVEVLDGAGRLAAYAACAERADVLEVCDFLADPTHADAAHHLWNEIAIEAYRRGLNSASVEFLGSPRVHAAIAAAGWVARERRALYGAFGVGAGLEDPARWYLTAADEDA